MAGIGPIELIVVLIIALLILGPKRLPDAGRSLGRGIREFKGAITGGNDDDDHVPTRHGSAARTSSASVAGAKATP